jgi:UDP-N-acetylglucosamine:LPS N-acetylglucosamine transferase
MYKPRVVFPFVEAGMGHIMPARSIADAFEEKYGNYTTVIRSKFFTETNKKSLITFEKRIVNEVKKYNQMAFYGWMNMFAMEILGAKLLSKIIMDLYIPGAKADAIAHMEELRPDMVVSTHWATSYYAQKLDNHPINVSYVPDVQIVPLFRYENDLTLVSAERGYKRALRKWKKRFNPDNLKLVPFAIRKEALQISMDKKENRRLLGLDENKFTVIMFEGGYGLGRIKEITRLLSKSDLNITVIAICGKNKKLYRKLNELKPNPGVDLVVEGFCEQLLNYLAASDVFLGKSGASSVAEPTYFGLAEIITKYATSMERDNAEYYIKDVKNAIRIFDPRHVVKKLREFMENPKILEEMQENALKYHDKFGSEKTADILWEELCKKYPDLAKIKIE